MLYKKIKEICEIKKGKKVVELEERFEDSIRYIQIDDLRNDNQMKYCSLDSNYVYVNKNDLIIAWDGANAGTVGFNLEGAIGSTLAKISVISKIVFAPFLALYLQSKFDYFQRTATGATIPHISRTALEDLEVPIFTMEQQKYIFDQLMRTKELIKNRQSQITALEELTQSLFLEMFGAKDQSELTEISEIAEVLGGLQVSGKRKDNPIEVPYLRVGNVYRNALVLDEIKFIRVTENELKRTILKKHDILVVEGHGNKKEVGRASRWNGEISNCVHQNHLIKVRVVNENVRPEYLCSFINSIDGRIHMYKNSNTTSGLNTISTNVVRKMKVYIPPLTEQDKFIALEDKINKKRKKMSESLVQIKFLYNSLLQKAFKGELFPEQ